MLKETPENKKIIGNAISAYLLILVSVIFVLNKNNKYLNNSFVKSHTKVAFLIHLGFVLTFVIFVLFGLGDQITIFSYGLNNIISGGLFIVLFGLLILGIYNAYLGKSFNIRDIKFISQTNKLVDVTGDGEMNEKDKLTIILSYIPFIGYIVSGKYYKHKLIKSISTFNLILSVIITLFFIFGNYNLATLFSLFYIIFIVYIGINLFINDKLININLPFFILSPEEKFNFTKNLKKYLKNYFNEETFIPLTKIIEEEKIKQDEIEKQNEILLQGKKDIRIKKWLIYIPLINLLFIFFLDSKYKFHIINGLYLTCFIIIAIILDFFGLFYTPLNALFLFPIFYGIGYISSRPAYKMPFIYFCYETDMGIMKSIKNIFSKTNEIRKKEEIVNLVPKNIVEEKTVEATEIKKDENVEKKVTIEKKEEALPQENKSENI